MRWVMCLVAVLAAAPAMAGEVMDAIRARGALRVGTTGDYKPYSFREADGTYRGADVEMARLVAAGLGVGITFVPTSWGTMMADFQADRFDMAVGGVTVLPARAAAGAFSPVLVVDGKRPIVRCADADRFTSLAAIDQPGVRVVVNPGAANEAFAREKFPHAQVTVHGDNATVFDEIVAGRADVMVTDGVEVDHQAAIHKELCAAHVPAAFTRLEKAFWLQRDQAFDAAVDRTVEAAKGSGEWDRLMGVALREK